MSDGPEELESDDDELLQALAAFGDGAMDLLLDDQEEDVLDAPAIQSPPIVNSGEEPGSSISASPKPGTFEPAKPEIVEFRVDDSDSTLIRYTKELANAIYCCQPMPRKNNDGTQLENKDNLRCLFLVVAEVEIAFPLCDVREVIRSPIITQLPGTPAWLRGVTNVRGEVVSIIDLCFLLNLGPENWNAKADKAIIVNCNETQQSTAVVADRILGIRSVEEQEFDFTFDSNISAVANKIALDDTSQAILVDTTRLFDTAVLNQSAHQAQSKN